MLNRLICLAFIFSLFLASCSGRGRLILPTPSKSIELGVQEKSIILTRLKDNELPNTLRALLETEVKSGAGRDAFLQALTFKQPGFFRLEAFATGANALVFIATSDGSQFRAIIPGDKRVLIGAPSAKSLSSLIQLPLAPIEMVALVSGRLFPEFLESGNQKLVKLADGSMFYISVTKDNRELRARFDNENSLRILELSLSERGSGLLTAKYSYQVGELKLLSVLLPEIEAKVEIRELKPNVEISSEKVFIVTPPASYKIESVD